MKKLRSLYYTTFYKKRLEKERLQILSGLLDKKDSIWKHVIVKKKEPVPPKQDEELEFDQLVKKVLDASSNKIKVTTNESKDTKDLFGSTPIGDGNGAGSKV